MTVTAADQLKNYRKKAKLSQTEFANLIGVTQGQINHWETNHQKVSVNKALIIETATNGELTAHELRPDLPWPHIPSTSPDAAPPLQANAA